MDPQTGARTTPTDLQTQGLKKSLGGLGGKGPPKINGVWGFAPRFFFGVVFLPEIKDTFFLPENKYILEFYFS